MANAFQFRSLLGMSQPEADTARNTEAGDAPCSSLRAKNSAQVRDNLDAMMRQIEHARRDADQMMEDMSALEVDAGRARNLRRENDALREQLDAAARDLSAEASKAENFMREAARLKDELTRIRDDYDKSQREAAANALDAERIEDRLRATITAFDETKRELEIQREAKDKAEVDAACLRANLNERDRVQTALMQSETELRMQTVKLESQFDEVSDALARKERLVLEKTTDLERSRARIADLESHADAAREEARVLSTKYSDLKVSQDARVFSLNEGLEQERESHRMTRKLLEEERARCDDLSDEIALIKEQTLMSTKDGQKVKRELNSARSQAHEYGDKLKESHLHLESAHSDIQRLEAALEDAKKDATTFQRQANKADQLLRENTDLQERIAQLQQTVDRYRGKEVRSDKPIMLTSTKRSSLSESHTASTAPSTGASTVASSGASPRHLSASTKKANAVAAPNANVARIRRR